MDNLQSSIVKSLDGRDEALYAYLPYLLQDLWEIGASPRDIVHIIKTHKIISDLTQRVLDLGCGKGAVAIAVAREFGIAVHGIDAMPEFIAAAKRYAEQYDVQQLCQFEVGDMRTKTGEFANYDIAILGSIGPVFGNIEQTVRRVKKMVKPGGYIILDDGYLRPDSDIKAAGYPTRDEALAQLTNCRVRIIDEYLVDESFIRESDAEIFTKIQRRAEELAIKFPQQKNLFVGYLRAQQEENELLEKQITCVTWLLKC